MSVFVLYDFVKLEVLFCLSWGNRCGACWCLGACVCDVFRGSMLRLVVCGVFGGVWRVLLCGVAVVVRVGGM